MERGYVFAQAGIEIVLKLKSINLQMIARYVLSNFTGTVIDTFFLWIFSRYVFDSYYGKYVVAPFLSFEIAMLNNFINSYFWIWKDRVAKSPKDFVIRLFFYNVNAVAVFFIKAGLILLVEFLFGLDVVLCNLIALLFTGIINLVMQDKLIFKTVRYPN